MTCDSWLGPHEERCMRVRPAVTGKIFIEQGCLWSYKSRERFLRMHWVSTASSPASLPITILTLLCPNRQRRERSDWGTDTASIVSIFHGYKVQKFLLGAWQAKEDVRIKKDCQIFSVLQAVGIRYRSKACRRKRSCSLYWKSAPSGELKSVYGEKSSVREVQATPP